MRITYKDARQWGCLGGSTIPSHYGPLLSSGSNRWLVFSWPPRWVPEVRPMRAVERRMRNTSLGASTSQRVISYRTFSLDMRAMRNSPERGGRQHANEGAGGPARGLLCEAIGLATVSGIDECCATGD